MISPRMLWRRSRRLSRMTPAPARRSSSRQRSSTRWGCSNRSAVIGQLATILVSDWSRWWVLWPGELWLVSWPQYSSLIGPECEWVLWPGQLWLVTSHHYSPLIGRAGHGAALPRHEDQPKIWKQRVSFANRVKFHLSFHNQIILFWTIAGFVKMPSWPHLVKTTFCRRMLCNNF